MKPGQLYPESEAWFKKKQYFTQSEREMYVEQIRVLWCMTDDPETNAPHQVGHSFPDSDPNRRHFEETKPIHRQTGNSYGQPVYQDQDEVTTIVEMCGYHWERVNPFRAATTPEKPKGEILAENEEYNRGWQDAELHYKG